MKFTVDYPIVNVGYDPALVTAAGMTRVAQAAEECGYDAISFSEHPAPSQQMAQRGRPRVARPDLGPRRSAPPSPAGCG